MTPIRKHWARVRAFETRERMLRRGRLYARAWAAPTPPGDNTSDKNPLRDYFDSHIEGRGIWKWEHYFEIYQRHFGRFVGAPVDLLEIGIYSGGSLDMWLDYFGEACRVYGVDIEPACRAYESDRISVFIGDQEDRAFWASFAAQVPAVDIVIDDGGHTPEQQMVTLEEMLPRLRPGGVFMIEDVHGCDHSVIRFASGLIDELNRLRGPQDSSEAASYTTPFQRAVYSIHFYPYVIVIERRESAPARFVCPKHGTEWQPFL